jgi:hypothetical protein
VDARIWRIRRRVRGHHGHTTQRVLTLACSLDFQFDAASSRRIRLRARQVMPNLPLLGAHWPRRIAALGFAERHVLDLESLKRMMPAMAAHFWAADQF